MFCARMITPQVKFYSTVLLVLMQLALVLCDHDEYIVESKGSKDDKNNKQSSVAFSYYRYCSNSDAVILGIVVAILSLVIFGLIIALCCLCSKLRKEKKGFVFPTYNPATQEYEVVRRQFPQENLSQNPSSVRYTSNASTAAIPALSRQTEYQLQPLPQERLYPPMTTEEHQLQRPLANSEVHSSQTSLLPNYEKF